MVGTDCLLRDSAVEGGESAVVAGDRGDDRYWLSDQVHDGILCLRNPGRSSADACTAVSGKRVVLGRDDAGVCDLFAESGVAGAPWVYLAALSAAHSCARCGRGAGEWISNPAILALRKSGCGAVVDGRIDRLFAGPAVSVAGVDVFDPAGAVRGGEGTRLLPGSGVSDVDGDGRGHGRALGCVAVEDAAACCGGGVFHRTGGEWIDPQCDSSSADVERKADETCAGEQRRSARGDWLGRTGEDGCGHSGFAAGGSAGERGRGRGELRRARGYRDSWFGLSPASSDKRDELGVAARISCAAADDADRAWVVPPLCGPDVHLMPGGGTQRE